jgi:hypothetical protein
VGEEVVVLVVADYVVFGVEVEDVEFFAGAFLEADGLAEADDHFGSGDSFGVDDLGFADESDAVAGYGDGGGFGGEERECRAAMFHGFGCLVERYGF